MSSELRPDDEFVLRIARERGVRFVRLWFVDVLGILKSVAIPVAELAGALEHGVGIDGSALEGRERRHERDIVAFPDPTTFQVVPWREEGDVARVFCELKTSAGAPWAADSRLVLRRTLTQAAELGYQFLVGPEIEFFLFDDVSDGAPPRPLDAGAYFDLMPLDAGSDVRRQTIGHLERMGIPVTASHHEAAPSQHEIDLGHADALTTADAITTFRLAVKEVARATDRHATFMPKPLSGEPGSGLHLHLSLHQEGRNVFHPVDPDDVLSATGKAFLAGILAHAREMTAVTNQWTNSYKRLVSGFEAPEVVSWTRGGGSTLARVPENSAGREESTRIELRSPDPACNPYLTLALVLGAGLRGIERGYQLPREDAQDDDTPPLPGDLREALEAFERSDFVREVLGEGLCETFLRNKHAEVSAHRHHVTELERRTLLRVL